MIRDQTFYFVALLSSNDLKNNMYLRFHLFELYRVILNHVQIPLPQVPGIIIR